MEERSSTYVYMLHPVQYVIQLVEVGPHSNIPKQDIIEVSFLKNSDRQSMETM